MYQLRDEPFSAAQSESRYRTLISNSDAFNFNMDDIRRLRQDMRQLIERLSDQYVPWKKAQDKKAREKRHEEKKQAALEKAKDSSGVAVSDAATATAGDERDLTNDLEANAAEQAFSVAADVVETNVVTTLGDEEKQQQQQLVVVDSADSKKASQAPLYYESVVVLLFSGSPDVH